MNSVKQLTESRHRLFRLLAFIGLIVLSACNSAPEPQPQAQPQGELTRLATLTISADTTEADLASYGGEIVSFKPEAGFAILGFAQLSDELSMMSTTANQNTFRSPAVAAGVSAWANGASAWANGQSAWANGASAWSSGASAWANGFNAWSSGSSAWANGASAWASGHSAWANGLPALSSVGDNLHAFDAIHLAQGQLRAPKLGEGVVVAVIDTGVLPDHPAFKNSLTHPNTWYDFIDNDSYPHEAGSSYDAAYGHGTAVAGLILQVAPAAKIMPLRVLGPDGVGDTDDIVRAIEWAVLKGADVINISVGAEQPDPAIHSMLKFAASRGVFTTASVGNEGKNRVSYPAHWGADADTSYVGDYLLSVGSKDLKGKPSTFSNYGARNEVWAPGENLFSVFGNTPDGKRRSAKVTGTSFANPLVAGSLALALAENPAVKHRSDFHFKLKEAVTANGGGLDVNGYLKRLGLETPTPTRQALFVVGNTTNLASVDSFLARRLETLGFRITLQNDDALSLAQAANKDLILISSSIHSTKVGSFFKTVDVPVIVWEHLIYDDMDMAHYSGKWNSGVTFNGHALVGAQRGEATMYASAQNISYAVPTADAQMLSTLTGYPQAATTFTYDAGSRLVSSQASAKRAGIFFDYDSSLSSTEFTPSAAAIFDVLVVWTVSR